MALWALSVQRMLKVIVKLLTVLMLYFFSWPDEEDYEDGKREVSGTFHVCLCSG